MSVMCKDKQLNRHKAYINGKVDEIERTRIWSTSVVILQLRINLILKLGGKLLCFVGQLKVSRRKHGHEQVQDVQQNRSKDLFRRVKEPNLHRSSGSLTESLENER